jgi:N-acetylmuramic acid 6-phosphate (MurNAc-6-P) etherase
MSKKNDTIITGTEARLDSSCWIDRLSVDAALSVQLESQAGAAQAVQRVLPDIVSACHAMHNIW